ncbi:MAG: septal ring lytic transglycosylase RlpA family protein [Sulfuricellaceae bacterium]|nr:septal ring lytic transglycosylase RlpA family protein [Sulfuricellaceae bacterium]
MPNRFALLFLVLLFLGGCAGNAVKPTAPSAPEKSTKTPPRAAAIKYGGGYYQDDGPGENPPENLDAIPDAVPKLEPLNKFANNPYSVLGQNFVPETRLQPYKAEGIASWYGRKFNGQRTSSGEPYDMYGMTAAHPTLPIPSYAMVTNLSNHKSVVVRINDRGPFLNGRLIDLSYTAAHRLGIVGHGSARVEVDSIDPAAPLAQAAKPMTISPPVSSPLADNEASGNIYLQLGAFATEQNAETLLSRVREQIGSLADNLRILSRDGLFRVHLGPYHSTSEAQTAAAQLWQNLEIKPVMVVR